MTARLVWRQSSALRTLTLLVTLGLQGVLLHMLLRRYLGGLDRPQLLEIGFFASWVASWLFDLKPGRGPWYALVDAAINGCVLVCGAAAAPWVRECYLGALAHVHEFPEAMDWLGKDVSTLLTTRAVGYGGCYGAAVLLSRLLLARDRFRRAAERVFIPKAQRHEVCPCCGHPATVVAAT